MPMHARVVRIRVPADRLDEFARRVGETAPTIQALAGFNHGYVFVDRQRGEVLTVTLWDTPEHRDAAAPAAREILSGAAAATGGEVGELAAYEVGADVPPAAG